MFSWTFIRSAAGTSSKKKSIYYKNQPTEGVIEVMDVKGRGTSALGLCAWCPSGITASRKTWQGFAEPHPSPGSAGLIDQPRAAGIGVRDSLAWDQALSTGYTACSKIGN